MEGRLVEHGAAREGEGVRPVRALAPLSVDSFDRAVGCLYASLDLNATLDAVVEVLLAQGADRISLVIEAVT